MSTLNRCNVCDVIWTGNEPCWICESPGIWTDMKWPMNDQQVDVPLVDIAGV